MWGSLIGAAAGEPFFSRRGDRRGRHPPRALEEAACSDPTRTSRAVTARCSRARRTRSGRELMPRERRRGRGLGLPRRAACTCATLRALARREALAAATRVLGAPRRAGVRAEAPELLVMTGHQPELYHPGVWVKDFLLQRLADETGRRGDRPRRRLGRVRRRSRSSRRACVPTVSRCRSRLAVGRRGHVLRLRAVRPRPRTSRSSAARCSSSLGDAARAGGRAPLRALLRASAQRAARGAPTSPSSSRSRDGATRPRRARLPRAAGDARRRARARSRRSSRDIALRRRGVRRRPQRGARGVPLAQPAAQQGAAVPRPAARGRARRAAVLGPRRHSARALWVRPADARRWSRTGRRCCELPADPGEAARGGRLGRARPRARRP